MRLIDTIVEKENLFFKKLEECKKNGYRTYILGGGEGADNIERRARGFEFAGKLVNRQFFSPNQGMECLETLLEAERSKINIVVGFRGYKASLLEKWRSKIEIIIDLDCFVGNYALDPNVMTYSWVSENQNKLQAVYEELADDYSKEVFSAYINQKISMDYKYLRRVKTEPQYFEKGIMPLSEDEIFVDCGAYNGDSALAFINAIREAGILNYKKIISFEPDPYNFVQMCNRKIPNHICINKGTSDHQDKYKFAIMGTSSGISDLGEVTIETDTLDNMIAEKVTLVKMDIEGAELASLRGAQDMIKRDKPKLAICIYHRKEDLWEIQNFLRELVPQYRFYVRAYEETARELVLYAIP